MPFDIPSLTDVTIVGAGPTGLACALTLIKAGLRVTVVDSGSTNVNGCRAVAIHANTLETLSTIDVAQSLIEIGIQTGGATLFEGETVRFKIEVNEGLSGKTAYPFILLVPQHQTERLLEEKLKEAGGCVYRNSAVTGYNQVDGGIQVTFANGATIKTLYLVGADGVRSLIRGLADVEYKDPQTGIPYESPHADQAAGAARLVLADVYFASPMPGTMLRDRLTAHFAADTTTVYIPLHPPEVNEAENSGNFFRLVTFLRDNEAAPKEPDLPYLQRLLDVRHDHPVPLKVSKLVTSSRYRVRSAVAEKFFWPVGREGKVFLAGDAAHCHSPVGAQGMNLGICDAVSLGHAIATHFKSGDASDDQVLRAYSDQRRKIALEVVGLAAGLTTLNTMSTGWRKLVRNSVLYLFWSVPMIQPLLSWRLSGLVYRDPEVQKPIHRS